jgi:mannose-6-phosphate isomerase class I
MKNSDNVVRLGLTPKLKDIPTLLDIMNDTIDLDGIKVLKAVHGYTWNGLIIQELENTSPTES